MCRFSTFLALIVSFSVSLSAQEQLQVITAGSAGEKVRFTSSTGIAQMRVKIVGAAGDPLFDSAWKDGNVLDWKIESAGQPLADGSYRCIVMVKDLDGQVTEREAMLAARGGQISIEPRRADDGVTVVDGEESGPKVTILVHGEKDGAIVNTSGDLSFRFGKFFAGKDSEKMRLTAEGNLELDGVIRTKGIMFADGTVLGNVEGQVASGQFGGTNTAGPAIPQANATGRRLTPRLNAPANQFVVDSAGVHIGTTSAFGLDVAGNVTLASNLLIPTSSSTAGTLLQGGNRLLHTYGIVNVFLGLNAGNFTLSGGGNTGLGASTLTNNTTGSNNTASGVSALQSNTSGHSNTASGVNALVANNTGFSNTATGSSALANNTSGSSNTANGVQALATNTTGNENTASGFRALNSNTASGNTAIGASALLSNTSGPYNTATGANALLSNTTGDRNTACGAEALRNNTTGTSNTAVGVDALRDNTNGNENTASGFRAIISNNTGSTNTASGYNALQANTTGDNNTAFGGRALQSNTTGGGNIAIGRNALFLNTTGNNNIAVGVSAGSFITTGINNIYIGTDVGGSLGETSTIRIGRADHLRAFLAGVRGTTTGVADTVGVFIDSNGQLGTFNSSASVKRGITSMGEQSSALMKLRPVSFYYRSDTVGIRQYGLIAEEVAEVMPELVQFSPEGEAETVRYHFLPPLMLKELQKQHKQIDQQQVLLDAERKENESLHERLDRLERIVEGLKARQ